MAAFQRNNNRPLSDAIQVTANSNDWTVLVQCLHKSKQKLSQNGSDYRNYIFANTQGTLISVMTYEPAMTRFARLLQPYKRYYISNAYVKEANPDFQLGDYGYSWTLYGRTPVELVREPIPTSIPCSFDFIRFEDMYKHADADRSIAIRALVIASTPVPHPSYNSIREYIIINKEKRMMLLRLWDDTLDNEEFNISARLPEPTIIVGVNLKITTHHGLSVATMKTSYFLNDPPLAEDDSLLQWYAANAEAIKKLHDEKAYTDTSKLLPPPDDTLIVPLADFVSNISVTKAAWVAANMYMMPAQEKLWYSSCQHCGRSYQAPIGWETTCTSCGKETKIQPRSHIGVFLNDETKTVEATLFSPEADKLIGFTGHQIKEAADKSTPLTNAIAGKIHKIPVICFVKCYDKSYRGNGEMTYPIVKVYTQAEFAAFRDTKTLEPHKAVDIAAEQTTAAAVMIKEQQFFSPNTKLAIEEIANTSATFATTSAASPSPKRSLVFRAECPEKDVVDPLSAASSPTVDESACSTENQTLQNPGKKVKGKEIEK